MAVLKLPNGKTNTLPHMTPKHPDSSRPLNSWPQSFARLLALSLILILAAATSTRAASQFVPNGSFESPPTDFLTNNFAGWQKSPQPFWYNDPFFPWDFLFGEFLNTTNGALDHIDNIEGRQAAYLFALADVVLFQDYNSVAEVNASPAHQFNAQYEAGKSYTLTVGVLGGGGGMSNGVPFEISLYYRDAASNMVTVSSTIITNSKTLFPTNTHFTDFQVHIPFVKADDAWAGKRIGIKLASALTLADSALFGGYWDVDNVRLTESVVPNYSFETPITDFVTNVFAGWQKSPPPFWYGDPFFPWDYLFGEFLNTSNGAPDHLDNIEGNQAAYLFALADVALFQDYNSIGGLDVAPSHQFNAKFEPGKSYALMVGVLGGGGGMSNGVPFAISLYYRDDASNAITVASTTITNTKTLFPTNTHFTDFQVNVPRVTTNDAWAGRNIGIKLASALTLADSALFGGYWDVDNVRLTESALPNSSFEFPETDFVANEFVGWEKSPQPFWYTDPFFPWDYLFGQFLNTTNGASDHIDNIDGRQAAYMFALADVALFQDYISLGTTNATPSHDFNLKYERGNSYNLTVGVLGGGGGMSNGVPFVISFYYRDAASNRVTIASTTITNSKTLFPTNTHFTDFQVQVPVVKGGEPWAGKHVGVQLASGLTLLDSALFGGYWNVDNIRVQIVRDPLLKNFSINTNQQFQFTLNSAPGRYEFLSSTNVAAPVSSWTSLGVFTNVTGTNLGNRFYQARTTP